MRLMRNYIVIPDELQDAIERARNPILLNPITATYGQCWNCGGTGNIAVHHVVTDPAEALALKAAEVEAQAAGALEVAGMPAGTGFAVPVYESINRVSYAGSWFDAVRVHYDCPMCSGDAWARAAAYRTLAGCDIGVLESGSPLADLAAQPRPVGWIDIRPKGGSLRTFVAAVASREIPARYDSVSAIAERLRRMDEQARAQALGRLRRLAVLVLERDDEPAGDFAAMLEKRRAENVTLTLIDRPSRPMREDQT